MSRALVFTFLVLVTTFAVAAWISASPRLNVQTIEANAGG